MNEDNISLISEILEGGFDNVNLNEVYKKSRFFSAWKEIVGKKFENMTYPYTLNCKTLIIACANSYVTQELSMYKRELLKKIKEHSEWVEVEEIIFSQKAYRK